MPSLAIVDFKHGRNCGSGYPYGECTTDCRWYVSRHITEADLLAAANGGEWPDVYIDISQSHVRSIMNQLRVQK